MGPKFEFELRNLVNQWLLNINTTNYESYIKTEEKRVEMRAIADYIFDNEEVKGNLGDVLDLFGFILVSALDKTNLLDEQKDKVNQYMTSLISIYPKLPTF